eukprot:3464052-Lingulodinium_polyedra.AAC.1
MVALDAERQALVGASREVYESFKRPSWVGLGSRSSQWCWCHGVLQTQGGGPVLPGELHSHRALCCVGPILVPQRAALLQTRIDGFVGSDLQFIGEHHAFYQEPTE